MIFRAIIEYEVEAENWVDAINKIADKLNDEKENKHEIQTLERIK